MPKKITAIIKLALSAGKATPAPPVGPALGQHGVNIAAFCKEYNAKTNDKNGLIIPVEILVYEENYEQSDGTIASLPNLQKVLVFDEILMDKKSCCAALDLQAPAILPKSTPKTPKKATA